MVVHKVPNDDDDALALHAVTLGLSRISCSQLQSRGVDLARHLGYSAGGIQKGSQAARAMSREAKQNGGTIPSVKEGGVSASLQSVGALGSVIPKPMENIRRTMQRNGLLRDGARQIPSGNPQEASMVVELPRYFRATIDSPPALVDDYKEDGYNYHMAEVMLNDSILQTCRDHQTHCNIDESSRFKVHRLTRIENIERFEQYKRHEKIVTEAALRGQYVSTPVMSGLPLWLQKLSKRNGLSETANTVYLLHGTTAENVELIVEEGLKTRFSLNTNPTYGRGLYFTDNACKASQYTQGDNVILVCRVVLGNTEVLRRPCPRNLFPAFGCDSAMAKKGYTKAPHGLRQLHNEFIVFNDCACYPEFVTEYSLE